jgi:hypothetical protein
MAIGLSGHHTTKLTGDDGLIVELELDGHPDQQWIQAFLGDIDPNPATPPRYTVDGNAVKFRTNRGNLERSFERVAGAIHRTNSGLA